MLHQLLMEYISLGFLEAFYNNKLSFNRFNSQVKKLVIFKTPIQALGWRKRCCLLQDRFLQLKAWIVVLNKTSILLGTCYAYNQALKALPFVSVASMNWWCMSEREVVGRENGKVWCATVCPSGHLPECFKRIPVLELTLRLKQFCASAFIFNYNSTQCYRM